MSEADEIWTKEMRDQFEEHKQDKTEWLDGDHGVSMKKTEWKQGTITYGDGKGQTIYSLDGFNWHVDIPTKTAKTATSVIEECYAAVKAEMAKASPELFKKLYDSTSAEPKKTRELTLEERIKRIEDHLVL